MKQLIEFLEGAKVSAQDAIDSLPKQIDEHSAKIATDNQSFIKQIDQALLVLSNVSNTVGECEHIWRSAFDYTKGRSFTWCAKCKKRV